MNIEIPNFLGDCEGVLTEIIKDVCNVKDRKEKSVRISSPAHLVLNNQRSFTHCREENRKHRKNFCRSGSTDELREEHIVCNVLLEHDETRACSQARDEHNTVTSP